jgi:hypothetical protein
VKGRVGMGEWDSGSERVNGSSGSGSGLKTRRESWNKSATGRM